MKSGDKITIYEDPLTQNIIESKDVELLQQLDTSGELEYWRVIFPDGGHAERWILSEGFQKGQK